jgi:hypothetical protein
MSHEQVDTSPPDYIQQQATLSSIQEIHEKILEDQGITVMVRDFMRERGKRTSGMENFSVLQRRKAPYGDGTTVHHLLIRYKLAFLNPTSKPEEPPVSENCDEMLVAQIHDGETTPLNGFTSKVVGLVCGMVAHLEMARDIPPAKLPDLKDDLSGIIEPTGTSLVLLNRPPQNPYI